MSEATEDCAVNEIATHKIGREGLVPPWICRGKECEDLLSAGRFNSIGDLGESGLI